MRLSAIILALLMATSAVAQQLDSSPLLTDGQGLIRSYPLDHSGTMDPMGARMWIDFEQSVGATVTSSDGGYTFTVTGTPTKVTDGTWPNGLSGSQGHGWKFNAGPNIYRNDDDSFDPGAEFSILAVADMYASPSGIASKWNSGGYGWMMDFNGSNVRFRVSGDGTTYTTLALPYATINRTSCIVATYNTGNAVLYVDSGSASSASFPLSAYNTSEPMKIGYVPTVASGKGTIHHLAYFDRALTATEVQKLCAQWRGTISTSGNLVTTTSTSPPAIPLVPPDSGTEPYLMDMPANTSQVGSPASGSGGLYGASAITNLIQRSSFETWASSDDATGWDETTSAGDGTANISENTTHMAHGASSLQFELTGTTSYAFVRSACITSGVGSDLTMSAHCNCTSGTCSGKMIVVQYSTTDCTGSVVREVIDTASISSGWQYHTHTMDSSDWDGSTQSWVLKIKDEAGTANTLLIDAVQARSASYATDAYCGADTDASAVCTASVPSVTNPLSANGDYTVGTIMYSPWGGAGVSTRYFLALGTVGTANSTYIWNSAANTLPYLTCIDSAGVATSQSHGVTWTATTDHTLSMEHRSGGDISIEVDGTVTRKTATCTKTVALTPFWFGGYAISQGADLWVRALKFYRRIIK